MKSVESTGMVFIELQGVAEATLRRAIAAGDLPFIAALAARGHRITSWEPDLAGDVVVSHAGLFYGDTFDLPAATWFDKSSRRIVNAVDVVTLRSGHGAGLLAGGISRGATFAGGASAWTPPAQTLDLASNSALAGIARGSDVLARGGHYSPDPETLALRDIENESPLVYVVLSGRPEENAVSAHWGDIDDAVKRVFNGSRRSSREYVAVLLSATGSIPAVPFSERFGTDLVGVIRELAGPGTLVTDGCQAPASADIVVEAGSGLAQLSFPRMPRRLSREEIDEHHPGLIARLVGHPGIAFVLANSPLTGGVVIGRHGELRLDDDRQIGENPLAGFPASIARHLRRQNLFANCPDLLLAAAPAGEHDDAVSFTTERAVSGGLGGEQALPFILAPSNLELGPDALFGSAAVHQLLGRWRQERS